ncbi:hypothetical protein FJTKL_10715 [Diaporthe vaccinii]|uniref:Uncharacterized protein n=1 Tax=Diaporthe vaccinii TaxID=105482 RepID=A0ABR4FBG2_9PEZI
MLLSNSRGQAQNSRAKIRQHSQAPPERHRKIVQTTPRTPPFPYVCPWTVKKTPWFPLSPCDGLLRILFTANAR